MSVLLLLIMLVMPSNKDRFGQKIEDIYKANSKVPLEDNKTYLFLEVSGDVDDASALMPLFKYNFKN